MNGFGVNMNINLYKQASNGNNSGSINNNSGPPSSSMKDSIAFSKINQKIKKRQMN